MMEVCMQHKKTGLETFSQGQKDILVNRNRNSDLSRRVLLGYYASNFFSPFSSTIKDKYLYWSRKF